MNFIFKLIAFPITLVIGIISAVIVIIMNFDIVKQVKNKKINKGEAMKRLYSDFDHFILYEQWLKIFPLGRMLFALVVYYLIFNPF